LCADLGISNELLQAPPHAPRYVLIDGHLRPVPLSPPAFFMSSLVNAPTKWALVRDILGKSVPPDADESVAAFVRRKFSPQLLDHLVGPFVSGVYAGDPERLSLRSAFPSLHEAEKSAGSIIRGTLRAPKTKTNPRERPTLPSPSSLSDIASAPSVILSKDSVFSCLALPASAFSARSGILLSSLAALPRATPF